MLVAIDGDIVIRRCAASAENDPSEAALERVDKLMHRIIEVTNATEYAAFLGSTTNFRKSIFPEYKANRPKERPKWLSLCNEFLQGSWNATHRNGVEADDLLAMAATEFPGKSVIATIDKDLRQVPGKHFNFVKDIIDEVDEYTAIYNFYRQLLIGDSGDNVKGVFGIGKVKAEQALYGLTEEEMFDVVREMYSDDERMLVTGQVLWIWRNTFDLWMPKQLEHLSIGQKNIKLVQEVLSN